MAPLVPRAPPPSCTYGPNLVPMVLVLFPDHCTHGPFLLLCPLHFATTVSMAPMVLVVSPAIVHPRPHMVLMDAMVSHRPPALVFDKASPPFAPTALMAPCGPYGDLRPWMCSEPFLCGARGSQRHSEPVAACCINTHLIFVFIIGNNACCQFVVDHCVCVC